MGAPSLRSKGGKPRSHLIFIVLGVSARQVRLRLPFVSSPQPLIHQKMDLYQGITFQSRRKARKTSLGFSPCEA